VNDAEAVTVEWRRVVVGATVGAAVLNLVINTAVGLITARGLSRIPLWGISVVHPSVITDSLGALISLPLFTCLICTAALRREQRAGQRPALAVSAIGRLSPLSRLSLGRRAWRLAAITFVVVGPPIVTILLVVARSGMTQMSFVIYHVALTVVLGAIVTPIVAVIALTDQPPVGVEPRVA
jgi:membrane glycosyltransferase